jgi:AcrR family transcriptional regulator
VPRRAATARDRRAREIARTRQDIVEAAARVFAEHGYHDATMQAIAHEAGFTAASLYTYFKSKDELYDALLAEMKRAMLASFDEPAPAGLTFPQRLELLVQRQIALVVARRDVLRLAFAMRPRRMQPDEGPADFLRRFGAFLEEHGHGQLRCGTDEGARILFGLFQATLIPFVFGDAEVDLSQEAGRITDFFLHGVEKRPPPQRS